MHLYYAKTIADCLVRELEPYCHIIYIAGSIRRKKEEVKQEGKLILQKHVNNPKSHLTKK